MIIISFLKLTWIVYILDVLFFPVVSACTWPTALQDGVWIDSDKGNLSFNATHMFGWRLKTVVSSTVVTDWVCQNKTGDFLVARASNNIDPLKSSFIAFLCLNMTQISNYSFYYYQHSAEQPNSNYERFAVTFSSMFTSFISNLSNMCTEKPATSEFHMLLKDGFQNESKVYCPDAFLGMFSYTINNGSTTACGYHNELWDVCSDRKVMTFNYNACTALIAYSALGRVYCVNSLTSGMYYYAAVYNTDTAENTYRFTCLMGSLSGNDVNVSQSPNSCTKTQITTSVPVTANGTSLGAFMYLRAYNTCRFESPSTSTSTTSTTSTSTTRGSTTTNVDSTVGGVTTNDSALVKATSPDVGAIVGGTVGGLLLLIALVGSIILFYLCVLKKKPPKRLLEEKYTKGVIAKRKQITPYTEVKKENSLAQVKDERSNDTRETEVMTSKIMEQNKIIQKTGEKINFTDKFIFSKEGTGLEVTQQPPMETAYRQTPIFDRDRSTIVLVVTENVPEKTSDTNAPKTDGKLSSIIVTPTDNSTRTTGNAGLLVCSSPSPFLDKAHGLSISKECHDDGSNHFTSNAIFALSVRSARPSPFRESDISTKSVQEYSAIDSERESGDEDAGQVAAEAGKDKTPLDQPHPTQELNSLTDGQKFTMNTVSGFDKYGVLPPLGFDSPGKKSAKDKRRRKKKRKSKSKHESGRSPSTVGKSSLRTALTSTGVSAGSQVSSSDMSIFETSVILSAQTDSSISDKGDLNMKGLLSRQPDNAYPDLYGKDIIIRENKSAITNPATPTTSTGLGEVVSVGQGPVTVDIP